MLKKTIPYKDVHDNDVEDTFYFNLSKAEMAEMALEKEGKAGGFDVWVRTLISSQDGAVLTATFKKILLATVGEPSEDGKRFVKSEEIRQNFVNSDAYSELFMELLTDADKMSAFINGIVPAAMRDAVTKQIESIPDVSTVKQDIGKGEPNPTMPKDERPAWFTEGRIPTEAELKGATPELMMEAFRRKSAGAGPVTQEQIAQP